MQQKYGAPIMTNNIEALADLSGEELWERKFRYAAEIEMMSAQGATVFRRPVRRPPLPFFFPLSEIMPRGTDTRLLNGGH